MTLRAIDFNGHVPQPSNMTEAELYAEIEKYCDALDLAYMRNPDSRRVVGNRGFPDYVITGPRGAIFREVKDERNPLSVDQREWGRRFMLASMSWGTWRPRDLYSGRILYELQELTVEWRAALRFNRTLVAASRQMGTNRAPRRNLRATARGALPCPAPCST